MRVAIFVSPFATIVWALLLLLPLAGCSEGQREAVGWIAAGVVEEVQGGINSRKTLNEWKSQLPEAYREVCFGRANNRYEALLEILPAHPVDREEDWVGHPRVMECLGSNVPRPDAKDGSDAAVEAYIRDRTREMNRLLAYNTPFLAEAAWLIAGKGLTKLLENGGEIAGKSPNKALWRNAGATLVLAADRLPAKKNSAKKLSLMSAVSIAFGIEKDPQLRAAWLAKTAPLLAEDNAKGHGDALLWLLRHEANDQNRLDWFKTFMRARPGRSDWELAAKAAPLLETFAAQKAVVEQLTPPGKSVPPTHRALFYTLYEHSRGDERWLDLLVPTLMKASPELKPHILFFSSEVALVKLQGETAFRERARYLADHLEDQYLIHDQKREPFLYSGNGRTYASTNFAGRSGEDLMWSFPYSNPRLLTISFLHGTTWLRKTSYSPADVLWHFESMTLRECISGKREPGPATAEERRCISEMAEKMNPEVYQEK